MAEQEPPKRRGRPPGSKNKPKGVTAPQAGSEGYPERLVSRIDARLVELAGDVDRLTRARSILTR